MLKCASLVPIFVFAFIVSLPRGVAAQETRTETVLVPEPPGAYRLEAPPPPPLDARDSSEPARDRARRGPGVTEGRVGSEMIGAALGVGGAFVAGLAVGALALGAEDCSSDEDFCGLGAVLLGFGVGIGGVAFLVPLGVTIAGNLNGGSGSYGAALLGNLLGAAIGWGGFALVGDALDEGFIWAGVAFAVCAELAGTIIGYEITSDDNYAPAIAPSVAPTADGRGAVLSLGGRLAL